MKPKVTPLWLLAACLLFTGCDFEAPLTPVATHKVDARLVGDWVAAAKDGDKQEFMVVRKFDDTTYAVAVDDDIYRVYHSDFAGQPFVSVQELNSSGRGYCLYTWSLSADGNQLTLRRVDTKVIPEKTKTGAELQKLIQANLANPELLEQEIQFARKKR